jgi:hypothetical protein
MVLAIASDGRHLNCAEVNLASALGFGKYEFTIGADVSDLAGGDVHVVFGMFLFKDDTHELDVEFARWGNASAQTNADYVVQPNPGGGASSKAVLWTMPDGFNHTVHTVDWTQNRVSFSSAPLGSPGTPISEWVFDDRSKIPAANGMLVRINMWLFNPTKVSKQFPGVEGVISDFKFTPATPTPVSPTPKPAGPTPAPSGQCTGCVGGTHGQCKAGSGVCYPTSAGVCPPGTTHC